MTLEIANIFSDLPDTLPEELFDPLFENGAVRIERIVSKGHATPEDSWYDQDQDEWILLLRGKAQLRYDDGRDIVLTPGDYCLIPAHVRHRVEWTDPNCSTVWLAVHVKRSQP